MHRPPGLLLAAGEHGPHLARSVEKHVRWFWRFVMCPLLFGLIGTTMNFNTLPTNIIPKSVAIICAGSFTPLVRASLWLRKPVSVRMGMLCKQAAWLCLVSVLTQASHSVLLSSRSDSSSCEAACAMRECCQEAGSSGWCWCVMNARPWSSAFATFLKFELDAGLAVRIPLTWLVMCFSGFTFKEKLFFALAWTPKACHPPSVSFQHSLIATMLIKIRGPLDVLSINQTCYRIPQATSWLAELKQMQQLELPELPIAF